jgi:putative toxin-antitoxin system antitoxin component (TIGR02293 family)
VLIDAVQVAAALGGRKALGRQVRTTADLMEAVEAGLPKASLQALVQRWSSDAASAREIKRAVAAKSSLARREENLSKEESERLERLARVTALAEHVWSDPCLAHEFLTSPQPQLGGERPLDLARSELGARRVEQRLYAVEYALPA